VGLGFRDESIRIVSRVLERDEEASGPEVPAIHWLDAWAGSVVQREEE
jgi:hypothetical protein